LVNAEHRRTSMLLAGRSATRPSTFVPEDTDDAVWIAQQMVLDAGAQAARLRRQASAQAAAVCEVAERETEMVWQQASAQAAAIREAAEREAAQLRATVMKLSAGPLVNLDGDVASQEAVRLAGQPGARTAGKPASKPEIKRGSRREAGPGARPARRPQGLPRQLVAMRVAAAGTSALFLFALATGTTELALHGFKFFVFRETGVGETGPSAPTDQQFVAQQAAAVKAAAVKAAAAKAAAAKAAAAKAQTPARHPAIAHRDGAAT
jgi:hypothetical protein